jgi:hypothetical protein
MTDPRQSSLRKRKNVDYTRDAFADVEEESSGDESDESESEEEAEPAEEGPKVRLLTFQL